MLYHLYLVILVFTMPTVYYYDLYLYLIAYILLYVMYIFLSLIMSHIVYEWPVYRDLKKR